jgi:hypothetical protein
MTTKRQNSRAAEKRPYSSAAAKVARTNYMRRFHIKHKFGLTLEAWEDLFDAQGRACAICKSPTPNGTAGRNGMPTWATDHNHETRKVRGILCNNCNHGLGHFKDNQTLLRLAIEYLDKAGE